MKATKFFLLVALSVIVLAFAPLYSQSASSYVWAIAGDGRYLYAAGWQQGVFRSPDDGNSWELVDPVHKEVRALLADSAFGVFAANQMGGTDPNSVSGIFRSTDHGNSWMPVNSGLTNHFVTSLISIRPSYVLLAGVHDSQEGRGVFRSRDNGRSWRQISQIMQWGVSSFVQDGNVIYAGTRGSGVWRSTDEGETWVQVNEGFTNPWITSVVVTPNGTVFASAYPFDGGIFRSTDHGEDWQRVYADTHNPRIMCLATTPDGTLYGGAYTDGGIYSGGVIRSGDGGQTWQQVAGTQGINVAVIFVQGNNLFLGTLGNGVIKLDATTTVEVEKESTTKLATFVLHQNYPNPFNPETTIEFALQKDTQFSIKIYSMLGQVIRTLINQETYRAGVHRIIWDGRDDREEVVPSGIYFYRLESGSFVAMKKMILMK